MTAPNIDRRAASHLSWKSPVVALAFAITLGFFLALFTMLGRPDSNPDMMLGALMAAFSGIVGYYFGSSSKEAGKDAAISDLTRTAATVATTAQASQAAAQPLQAGEVKIDAESVTVDGKPS